MKVKKKYPRHGIARRLLLLNNVLIHITTLLWTHVNALAFSSHPGPFTWKLSHCMFAFVGWAKATQKTHSILLIPLKNTELLFSPRFVHFCFASLTVVIVPLPLSLLNTTRLKLSSTFHSFSSLNSLKEFDIHNARQTVRLIFTSYTSI